MRRIILSLVIMALSAPLWADALLSGAAIGSGGQWKGLYFAQPQVITIVGWNPTSSNDVLLGVFEGANRSDFMDAVPLAIISEQSDANRMNYLRIECSRGFRYVRLVAPSGKNISNVSLEFYGDQGDGDDSHLAQLTNLPVVYIHTVNNVTPYDKEHEIDCFISIISNNGQTILSDTATIRERGNASRGFPKKPYRIKFAHKHQVLGSPANAKKWTLINNYGDKTLMRNQLAFELSRRLEMPYTPFCTYVDVVLNGDYKGCYQLCDQIEVRKNRVEITEMKPTDNSGEALTGGYLIEADAYAGNETSMFWSEKGTGVTIKSPDEDSITWEQSEYIRKHYSKMEKNWKTYLDLNTFLRHFLVGELSGNTDTYWSMYLYKQRANDTMYVGPVWDFDLAFENDNRTYPIRNLNDYIYRTNGSTTGYLRSLVDKIVINDAAAKQQLLAIWAQARQSGLTEESMIRYIDEQQNMLQLSQRLNFMRWPIMSQYVHQNPRIWGSYDAEVENVRKYIRQRIPWMDNKIGFDASRLDFSSPESDTSSPATRKILRDGQILILRNGQILILRGNKTYTLTGQEVTAP